MAKRHLISWNFSKDLRSLRELRSLGYNKRVRNLFIGLFCLVLALTIILRLWNLGGNPPGLTWDEAALGYNAYSILETGKDEYGTLLPLNLKSFGDYKPALYAYITIPFVAVLGLNEWAVRLPSAIFGVLGVLGAFLLVNILFKNKWMALAVAFMLAISPWHLQFSRAAYEANVALALNIWGTYLFVKGWKKSRWFLGSIALFSLSLFTYQSSRLFVPLLLISLYAIFYKTKPTKQAIFGGLGFLLVLAILFFSTFLTGQTNRLSAMSFFAYQRSEEQVKEIGQEDNLSGIPFEIVHGEWLSYVKGLAEHYFIYFSPKILFVDGDYSGRHRVVDLGLLYYFSLILIPIGLVTLIKRRDKGSMLILVWLILAPIPAVLSRDLITALRALNMVFPWVVIEGVGLYVLVSNLRGIWKYLGVLAISFLILLNFLVYLDRYYIHSPIQYSKYWLYGYKQTLTDLEKNKQNYNQVVITDIYGQPYIYYLFYNKYPPQKFQDQAVLDQPTVDVGTVRRIDNIEFRHIYWPEDRGRKNSLFIGSFDELPDKDILPFEEYRILKDVNFLDGLPAFRVVETERSEM